ncbi:MAG: aminomethyl-transferring glycine dehydrogenase [Ilumatobacteraceae bacterium]
MAASNDTSTRGFEARHIGPQGAAITTMLERVGAASLDELINDIVPDSIRQQSSLDLPAVLSEPEALDAIRSIAEKNVEMTSLIGMGYTGTIMPPVIRRNVLENPAWYTAYTPYQPEISQGRLEALLNFQTMVCELTGLPVANASLLDEATAAAEAMTMCRRSTKTGDVFFVDHDVHPQILAVLKTRAEPIGISVVSGDDATLAALDGVFGALFSFPSSTGGIRDLSSVIETVHHKGALCVVDIDPLAAVLLRSAGSMGADIAIGSAQRFGVPMGGGGPHAAFIAVSEKLARSIPGRLVGVSVDDAGRPALRLALQTREQHIRREKATSNICTAQVLLANIAGFYACWHGPGGLRAIAERVSGFARATARALEVAGFQIRHDVIFDTVCVDGVDAEQIQAAAINRGINIRVVDESTVAMTFDETTDHRTLSDVVESFGVEPRDLQALEPPAFGDDLARSGDLMPQEVFHRYHSEHEMLRYLRRLSDKDLALDRTIIPLGSCTMKLNATTEMEPISWSQFGNIHPYAPEEQLEGYRQLVDELERMLAEITGYDAVSLQPNAGSQGEFAGLLAIRAYHRSRGDLERNVCLIPSSAHGTNAASAVMAGMDVVVVACDERGDVDLAHLDELISIHGERVAAIMITYPSTHGVFETTVTAVCERLHAVGGQVYVDGANLNALVGVAQPGKFGADVSHLNLHKTFCIPHGGGGPGVGPVAVKQHLAEFLPSDPLGDSGAVGPVSAARFGSAGILPIPWVYSRLMGGDGLRNATMTAILAANYVASRLSAHFPILYTDANGRVAHECILDLRPITKATGVTVDDVAKRLMDHGIHAPTMSFPVAGTLMVEPTESESLEEIDRFCDAMISIRGEIDRVADGEWPVEESPLRYAPHTAEDLLGPWERPYSRELGAYPLPGIRQQKYFAPVARIDGATGDRNLICTCEPLEVYASQT